MDKKARVLLFTGDGKGKTTAALGMVMRASGHGLRSLVLQFVKSDATTGEIEACRNLPGVSILQTGLGFVPAAAAPEFAEHAHAAARGLKLAEDAVASGSYDLIVLDEICNAVARGLLDESRVISLVGRAKPHIRLVMTGRGATPGLAACADTVTEMRLVRHGLDDGIRAQEGVEY